MQATTPMVERALRVVDKEGEVFEQGQTALKLAQIGVSECVFPGP
jgi:hypothetical protein